MSKFYKGGKWADTVTSKVKGADPLNTFKEMWYTGVNPITKQTVKMSDVMNYEDAPLLINRIVEETIFEPLEPMLMVTGLMEKVRYTPGMIISGRVLSAVGDDFDMGEGEAYPEVRIDQAPGTAVMSAPRKVGAALTYTDYMLQHMPPAMVDREIGEVVKAFARLKEKKALRLLKEVGFTSHDNADPTESRFGITTARALDGTANGALSADDFFECQSLLWNNGKTPNVMFIHPQAWMMFIKDPILRHWANMNNGSVYFLDAVGNPAVRDPWASSGRGVTTARSNVGPNATNGTKSDPTEWSPYQMTAPKLPSYFSGASMNIVVSPWMEVDMTNGLCDIIMADVESLGYLLVEQDLRTEEWKNPERDTIKMKFSERYGFEVKDQGFGVVTMKNIKMNEVNQILLPAQARVNYEGTITALDRNSAVA